MRFRYLFYILNIFVPLFCLGAGLVPCGGPGEEPCQLCHIFVLFQNVLDFFTIQIVPAVAVLMIAIGGFMYVFAFLTEQEAAMLNRAKKVFVSVAIGLAIVYGAYLIINTFFQIIGVAEWTGLRTRWTINCP